jgi:hypothetical protein
MLIGLLICIAVVDLLLAALLVGISGFIFGSGPEGLHGEMAGVAVWTAGFVGCLAAPVAGFVLRRFGRAGVGVGVALLPPVVALVLAMSG